MGRFEDNIPHYIDDLKAEILKTSEEKHQLNWGHECDCEFCDRNEDMPEETYEEAVRLDELIKSYHTMIMRLKKHAKLHGIEIQES